jgi:hypothetical protein
MLDNNPSAAPSASAILGVELAADLEAKKEVEKAEKKVADKKKAIEEAKKKQVKIVLKNTLGEDVPQSDYFYSDDGSDTAPHFFHQVCGYAVDREDMLTVFNRVFKPKDGILFYKVKDKEIYLVIVPIKHSSVVGASHNSVPGDFQKHAISFITEGSVNLDTLRNKLARVASTIKIVAE